jgi:hypothetical protein
MIADVVQLYLGIREAMGFQDSKTSVQSMFYNVWAHGILAQTQLAHYFPLFFALLYQRTSSGLPADICIL